MAISTNINDPIGYYVHHHGTGHLRRALNICKYITNPVILFCSLPKPTGLPDNITYIQLISDVIDDYTQPDNSSLHYTPYAPAIFARNQQLLDAWQQYGVRTIYVDVSVEVALLAKLYGLRVGHAVMLGDRHDAAHSFGYQVADYLMCHFSKLLDTSKNRQTNTPVFYSGGISRFKKQPIRAMNDGLVKGRLPAKITVTVSPQHERDLSAQIIETARFYPDTTWHIIGQNVATDLPNIISHGVVGDPESIYSESDIIVGSGGTNTIMEVASIAKPFICIPEDRPYNEQKAAARALAKNNAAVTLLAFPKSQDWPALCRQLAKTDLQALSDLVDDQAAQNAAAIIMRQAFAQL